MNTPDFKSSFSQFASVVILGLYVSGCASLQHERSEVSSTKALATMPSSSSTAKNTPVDVPHPFVGVWTYRSLLNVAEHEPDINKLLFAEAELVIEESPFGTIKGTLNMGEYGSLTLSGSAAYGSPFSFRFQGVGKDTNSLSAGWVYDYIGWYVPDWPHGIDQKPALVGSVIRTIPHGQAKAGKVASFIAVRKQ